MSVSSSAPQATTVTPSDAEDSGHNKSALETALASSDPRVRLLFLFDGVEDAYNKPVRPNGWRPDVPISQWRGVSVDDDDGSVKEIVVVGELHGRLNLEALRNFDALFPGLCGFDVSGNVLGGEFCFDHLPPQLERFLLRRKSDGISRGAFGRGTSNGECEDCAVAPGRRPYWVGPHIGGTFSFGKLPVTLRVFDLWGIGNICCRPDWENLRLLVNLTRLDLSHNELFGTCDFRRVVLPPLLRPGNIDLRHNRLTVCYISSYDWRNFHGNTLSEQVKSDTMTIVDKPGLSDSESLSARCDVGGNDSDDEVPSLLPNSEEMQTALRVLEQGKNDAEKQRDDALEKLAHLEEKLARADEENKKLTAQLLAAFQSLATAQAERANAEALARQQQQQEISLLGSQLQRLQQDFGTNDDSISNPTAGFVRQPAAAASTAAASTVAGLEVAGFQPAPRGLTRDEVPQQQQQQQRNSDVPSTQGTSSSSAAARRRVDQSMAQLLPAVASSAPPSSSATATSSVVVMGALDE